MFTATILFPLRAPKMTSSFEDTDLLERVFLRIGPAESDEGIQATVKNFLIPVLQKLSTDNELVRKKVVEVLVKLNRRLRRRPRIQLPVEALLNNYLHPEATAFVINFSVLYIKMGYPRLPVKKQVELAPLMLCASARRPNIHQDSLLYLVTLISSELIGAAEAANRREFFRMNEMPELLENLCSFMFDMLTIPYAYFSEFIGAPHLTSARRPAGMSERGFKRVTTYEPQITAGRLEKIKLGILKFLSTGIIPDEDIACHFIIASADTRYSVANFADAELRRLSGANIWSSKTIASRLFLIYLGSVRSSRDSSGHITPESRILPANNRIRLKILTYLAQLENDALLFPSTVQVILNTVTNPEASSRLKLLAMNFAMSVIKREDDDILNRMGPVLYAGFLRLVWSRQCHSSLCSVAYAVISQIVRRMPEVISRNLLELQVFFDYMNTEPAEIRMAIRDAMMGMVDAYAMLIERPSVDNGGISSEETSSDSAVNIYEQSSSEIDEITKRERLLLSILTKGVESKEDMARWVAVYYSAAIFETNHIRSRFVLLAATGDINPDISKFAKRSLYDEIERDDKGNQFVNLADFLQMVEHIQEKAYDRLKNTDNMVLMKCIVPPFNNVSFHEVLMYLRLCLAQASSVVLTDKELMNHPCEHSPLIRSYILNNYEEHQTLFDYYLTVTEMLLERCRTVLPVTCLVEFLGTCPELFARKFLVKFELYSSLLNNPDEDVRDGAAFLLSMLTVYAMEEERQFDTIEMFLEKLEDNAVEVVHGAILTLGYIVQEKMTQLARNDTTYRPGSWPLLKEIILRIANFLENPYAILISAACTALGQIIKAVPIPLVADDTEELSEELSLHEIMTKFLDIASTNTQLPNTKEKAIEACAMISLAENFPFAKELIEKLLDISKETKDITIHFSIGKAIILCLEGISSGERRDKWRIKESDYTKPPMPEENLNLLESLLDHLISSISDPHPNTRQAVSVFLLYIIKNLYYIQNVIDKLSPIQAVFMELLSENDDIVQDIASKGLALVNECAPLENRKEFGTRLMNYILSCKRSVQQVSKLEESHLGARTNIGNLIVYKELCTLVAELNEPELIYKFMHLVSYNFVWDSKKGSTFGFRIIAFKARGELANYLPRIIPRLYRYRFDPNTKIQQSMRNIWSVLLKEPHIALTEQFDQVLDELITNLTSNQSRVRISCITALIDFLNGHRSVMDVNEKFPILWQSLFRLFEDIDKDIQKSARNAAKILADQCVHECDIGSDKVNEEKLQIAVSVFLSGVKSTDAEVRNISLTTMSQLANAAPAYLKPSLISLIAAMLEGTGELEVAEISNLSDLYDSRSQEVIDSVRMSIAKSQYTTQTATTCIKYIDLEMLDELVPKVTEILKGTSLGSKLASAHFIVSLSHHLGRSMESFTGKFLTALLNGLLDESGAVRSTFASTLGQILQVAKQSSLEKLFTKLSTLYFEHEDLSTRTAVGQALKSSAEYNRELLKDYFPILLPLIFFAMHEEKAIGGKSNAFPWGDLWNSISPGYETSIKKYINPIMNCVEHGLTSSSWSLKTQAGKCIQTIASKAGDNLDTTNCIKLIDMSLKGLQGETFLGKEDIIKGLVNLCTNSGSDLKQLPDVCQSIVQVLLTECDKSDVVYRSYSVEALGNVLETFNNMDFFQHFYELAQTIIQKLQEGTETKDKNTQKDEEYLTKGVLYVALGKSWPRNKETQLRYQEILADEYYKALVQNSWEVHIPILIALHYYIDKLHYFSSEDKSTEEEEKALKGILQKVCTAFKYALGLKKPTGIRGETLKIVITLGKKLISTGRDEELKILAEYLKDNLEKLEGESSSPSFMASLNTVKEFFKK